MPGTSINQGETTLDKAWAESEVADAGSVINNTDNVIAWFRNTSGAADSPDLAGIIAERDTAANYLSAANDEIAAGNYTGAHATAQEAYEIGNESYSDALNNQSYCIGCGDTRILIPYFAAAASECSHFSLRELSGGGGKPKHNREPFLL